MQYTPVKRNGKKSRGFALIEILVSLVILAIGLLGTLGLQLATLRSNQFTAQAAVAAQLARDYEEIVQMVPSAAVSSSEGTSTFSVLDTTTNVAPNPLNCVGTGANCSPTEQMNALLYEWKSRVTNTLPAGRAVVCRDSTPRDTSGAGQGLYHWACDDEGDMIMIKMGWAAKADKSDVVMQAIATDDRPRIVITVFGNQTDFTN
jgi:type IV pilus assembly protein PilV